MTRAVTHILFAGAAFGLAALVWQWPLFGVPLTATALFLAWFFHRADQRFREQAALAQGLLEASFPIPEQRPALEFRYSYGFPQFLLHFPKGVRPEGAQAGRNIDVFKSKVKAEFQGAGPRDHPFDVEMAVIWTRFDEDTSSEYLR